MKRDPGTESTQLPYRKRRKDRQSWKEEERWDKHGVRVGKELSGRNRKGLTDG